MMTMTKTATDRRNPMQLLHVHVVDDITGEVLADIDADSTADGLAYFLRQRGINPDATAAGVAQATTGGLSRKEAFNWDERSLAGTLERALAIHVEGTAQWCAACKRVA